MYIPDSLNIMGHKWAVSYDPHLVADNDNVGEARFLHHKIIIQDNLPEEATSELLLHEVIEVINQDFELNLEHQAITILGRCLNQVLRDNKIEIR